MNFAEYYRSRDETEQAYADVCDEVNDYHADDPNAITLEDLNPMALQMAQEFANENDLPWPPGFGSYDNYYEWAVRRAARMEDHA